MNRPTRFCYHLEIQRVADGARFPGEPVPDGFLQEAHDQVIFLSQRRAITGPDAEEAVVHEQPIFAAADDSLIGGVRITVGREGRQVAKEFDISLFAPLAEVQARGLVAQGHLEKGHKFMYRVFAQRADLRTPLASLGGVVATVRRRPLPVAVGQLQSWLSSAEPVGPVDEQDFPLLISQQALDLSREYCRKPGDKEGGALLLGRLFQQLEPEPEVFGIIEGAIEARHAEQARFSLDLTAQSFADLHAQLQRRRTRLGLVNEVALGFAHAHNFLPSVLDDGEAQCPTCPLRPTCPLTSSFYSVRDEQFHRSLFSRQPYAVGLVWGLTPREEDDLRVFCLDGSQTRRRGYYRIFKHT